MRLQGKRIAYFVEQDFEDLEYWVPVMRLQEEGAQVVTLGTGKSEYTGKETKRIITYILEGDVNKFGLFGDFCCMGIKEIENY